MSKPRSLNDCLALLAHHAPHLPLDNPRVIAGMGQFNTVLCLDDRVIVRFPKSAHAARDLAHELRILPRLQGRLPLPIPAPMTSAQDSQGLPLFMAYPMLPGQPLLRGKYDKLRADTPTIDNIARDLADFLRVLHDIPPAELGLQTTAPSPRDEWAKLYADFQSQLYPYMRESARREVSRDFDLALADKDLWRMRACVTPRRHRNGQHSVPAGARQRRHRLEFLQLRRPCAGPRRAAGQLWRSLYRACLPPLSSAGRGLGAGKVLSPTVRSDPGAVCPAR